MTAPHAPISTTIFARASGAGRAGVAVYRLSGPHSHPIARQLIGKQIKSREAVLAHLRAPETGEEIDKGLVILFDGPASFTGEDVAEFHLHGARAVEACLYETLAKLGARPAEAGEFTLRALKAGKLDLAQVEALADLIDAETSQQRKQALGQLGGRLSSLAEGWRAQILAVMAPLEADIDFPDEDGVPAAAAARAGPAIARLKTELTLFLAESERARTIREGASIAIIGAPNAGKSSLINVLAGSDVAIVSDQPGTTRDIIEVRLDLGGVVARVADTAGLRIRSNDKIEIEGVRRARGRAEAADIRVMVVDPENVSRGTIGSGQAASPHPKSKISTSPEGEVKDRGCSLRTSPSGEVEIAFAISGEGSDSDQIEGLALLHPGDFLIWSKSDLGAVIPSAIAPNGVAAMSLSAKTGQGVEAFVRALTQAVAGEAANDGPALTRLRHVKAVEDAIQALSRAEGRIETAPELAAEDARLAARALGQITGAVGVEDVLGEIFSSFCIGK